jgi:hypothetical protein
MALPAMTPIKNMARSCMVTIQQCLRGCRVRLEKAPALRADSERRRSAFNGSQLATRNDGALSEIWDKSKLNRLTPGGLSASSRQFQQYLPL